MKRKNIMKGDNLKMKNSQKGITLISLMTGVNSNDVDEKGNVITSTEDDIQAIEKIFNVKVESVNTSNSHPKKKRVGRYTGMTNKYKKAIVKLAKGSTISFDE